MDDASVVEAPSGTKSSLSVALLHDYRESVSMRLYAERLGDALEGLGVGVARVRPREVIPPVFRRSAVLDKLDSYFGRFVAYPRIARRTRADVVHVVDHGQGHLVASLDPARTVVTCHDVILLAAAAGRIALDPRPRLATSLLRRALRAARSARGIIAVSERTRADLADLADVDPGRVEVIHPGLNYAFSPEPARHQELRRQLGLPSSPVILHVGSVAFYKNVPGCLRIIARLRRNGIDATFFRVGQAMTGDQRALASRLGIASSIIERGTITPAELADLYRAADVFLFPSLYEGFGWPPLEAMASGLPVVCSRAGSLGEVVGEAALTCEPEDVAGLAEAVARVLGSAEVRASLVRRGLERARAFDWRRTAAQVREVYRKVVEGKIDGAQTGSAGPQLV